MVERLYDILDTYYTFDCPEKPAAIQEIKQALANDPESVIKMLLDIIDDLE